MTELDFSIVREICQGTSKTNIQILDPNSISLRILSFSDIHDNIQSVRKLYSETYDQIFDLIIVAGDIGSKNINEFFSIMAKYGCPIYYVLGNWDYDIRYDLQYPNSEHLHLQIKEIGGYYFTGFSGCSASWGCNPIYKQVKKEIQKPHREILELVSKARRNQKQNILGIKNDFREKINECKNGYEDSRDKKCIKAVKTLLRKKDLKIAQAGNEYRKLLRSKKYNSYNRDLAQISKETDKRNKASLFELIKNSSYPQDKFIIVSHHRIFRLGENVSNPCLHIFGHRHTFKHTNHKGLHCLNVSALDMLVQVGPKRIEEIIKKHGPVTFHPKCFESFYDANVGNYAIVEIDDNRNVKVHACHMTIDNDKWTPVDVNCRMGRPLPEEKVFAKASSL